MADNFEFLGTRPDTLLVGDKVVNGLMAMARTVPHRVYFELAVDAAAASVPQLEAGLSSQALIFESMFSYPGVEDVAWYQKPNASQQLIDYVTLYISSTSGDSANTIDVPYTDWTTDFLGPAVADMRAYLDRLEAL